MEIYGTLGPACGDIAVLETMFRAGMTGLRLNLSHVTLEESRPLLERMRAAADAAGVRPDLLIDLQGPELRVGREGLPLTFVPGETVLLSRIPLPQAVRRALCPACELLLDDGKILLRVCAEDEALVLRGGTLLPQKSVALPGFSPELPALTEQDHENLSLARACGVTGVMQSFVRGRSDLLEVKNAMENHGCKDIKLYAKIESRAGLFSLADWIDLPDVLVIARGDLGNAFPLWEVPAIQKSVAARAKAAGKPFLVVTQMLASMENNPVPTRAEVSDVFNAVLDGASAVMLTGETAAGRYPAEAMTYLCNTARQAQAWLQEEGGSEWITSR